MRETTSLVDEIRSNATYFAGLGENGPPKSRTHIVEHAGSLVW